MFLRIFFIILIYFTISLLCVVKFVRPFVLKDNNAMIEYQSKELADLTTEIAKIDLQTFDNEHNEARRRRKKPFNIKKVKLRLGMKILKIYLCFYFLLVNNFRQTQTRQ